MTYTCDCDFVDYEVVLKEKTQRKYIYYHFRDLDTGDVHVIYDHRNDVHEARIVEMHRHRHMRIGGRVSASGSHQYLNLDFWAVILDGKVYDPVSMAEGVRRIGLGN